MLPLKYFGKELVLYRTEGGEACLVDAYCPHLGAHLGYGGHVDGECLICPFHQWQFNQKGQCVNIPYAKKIPPRAQLITWPLQETHGLIIAWHHPSKTQPDWEVPALIEINNPAWTPCRIKTCLSQN